MKRSARMIPLDSWMGFETIAVYGGSHESIGARAGLKFRRGVDDLDDTWEVALRLPSGRKIALVQHVHAPQTATSIMFAGQRAAVQEVLRETLEVLALQPRRLQWTAVPLLLPDLPKSRLRKKLSASRSRTTSQSVRALKKRLRFGGRRRVAALVSPAPSEDAD